MMLAIESLVDLIERLLILTPGPDAGAALPAANDNEDATTDARRRAIAR